MEVKTYTTIFDRAKAAYGTGAYDDATLEFLFPELRESEDERIRKWLLECVENLSNGNFIEVSKQDVLFYLEKQKEQPTNSEIPELSKSEWTEADEKMLSVITYKISQHQGNDERSLFTPDEAEFICEMEDKFKSLRSNHWKPSKEQMYSLGSVVKGAGEVTKGSIAYHLKELYEQLKKLM